MSYGRIRAPGLTRRRGLAVLLLAASVIVGAAIFVSCSDDEATNPPVDEHSVALVGSGGGGGSTGSGGSGPPGGVGPPSGGGSDEGFGNNLSHPVVFADGYGVTGLDVATDPGVRPTADEGITVTGTSAFFHSDNRTDYMGTYYLQKTENTWRAEWADGRGTLQNADVDWGDNLMSQPAFNMHATIRVEVVLFSQTVPSLTGFNMTLIRGTGEDEVQGTDGTTALFTPTVYTVVPRLTIEKLDGVTMQPIPGAIAFDGTVADGLGGDGPGAFGAEVNVAGQVIYGYNFFVSDGSIDPVGWWRITFSLEPTVSVGGTTVYNNVRLVSLLDAGAIYSPVLDPSGTSTWIDIYVGQVQGGGGGPTTTGGNLP